MTSERRQRQIRHYYRHTDRSFANWGEEPAYAMHFGYRDDPSQPHLESLARMNAEIADKAKIESGEYILDAGCGVGSSALWLARTLRARVCGITLAENQVERARECAQQAGFAEDRVEFRVADYEDSGLAGRSFDVVWAIESVCHAVDKRPFLREAHRLLRPGGRLVVADYFLTRDELELDEVERFAVDKWTDGWVIQTPPAAPLFKAALEDEGFCAVKAHDFTDAIEESARDMFERGKQGYPDDLLTKAVGVPQIRHVEACMFQKVALDLGAWRYLVYTAEK